MTDLDRSVPPPPAGPPVHTSPPPQFPELPEGVIAGEQRPRWKPWMSFAALVIGFFTAAIGFVVIGSVVALAGGSSFDDPPPGVTISATFFQGIALAGTAIFFARTVAVPRPWQFGLRPTRFWPAAGWTALAFAAFLGLSAIWVAALDLGDQKDTLPDELGVDESTAALIAVAFLVTVVAPIGEEFFFRGFFFRALVNWRGVWPAALVTGITFGGIHAGGSPVGFLVPLAIFGVLLCLLYARTQSLYPPIVLHAINNCLAFGVSQDWDWQIVPLLAGSLAFITLGARLVRQRFGPAPALPLPV